MNQDLDFEEVQFVNCFPEFQYLVIVEFGYTNSSGDFIQDNLFIIYYSPILNIGENHKSITKSFLIDKIKSLISISSPVLILNIYFKKIKLEIESKTINNINKNLLDDFKIDKTNLKFFNFI